MSKGVDIISKGVDIMSKRSLCIVYIHEYGTPDHCDYVSDLDRFGFDGYLCTEAKAKEFCRTFNYYNTDRNAYYVR